MFIELKANFEEKKWVSSSENRLAAHGIVRFFWRRDIWRSPKKVLFNQENWDPLPRCYLDFELNRPNRMCFKEEQEFRKTFVVIENFDNLGGIVAFKNKSAQTVKDSLEIIITSSKKNQTWMRLILKMIL